MAAAHRLPCYAQDAEQQGQHVEDVVAGVVLAVLVGQLLLVAQAGVVDGGDAADPVAQVRLAVAAHIVLAAGEVPHEVAPVHVVELVVEEVAQVNHKPGLPHLGDVLAAIAQGTLRDVRRVVYVGAQLVFKDDAGAVYLRTVGPLPAHILGYGAHVGVLVLGPAVVALLLVRGVHTGEEHLEVGSVLVLRVVLLKDILVGLAGVGLHHLGIAVGAVVDDLAVLVHEAAEGLQNGIARLVDLDVADDVAVRTLILFPVNLLGDSLSVEQGTLAVLLAVEVGGQGEHVVGRVLVHGRVGARAYEQQGVRRISHEDDEDAEDDCVEHAHGDALAELPQPYCQSGEKQDGQPQRVAADEGDAREGYADKYRQLHHRYRALAVELAYCPDKDAHKEHGVNQHARVIGQVQTVDKQQLEPLCLADDAGDKSVEDKAHYHRRQQQRQQRALDVGDLDLLVIEHQHYCGDAQQVEQVHGNRDADDVCYQHQVAVAVGLVGAVFPFQYQPEHQGGAERREGVNLALDRREPECVAPGIGQGAAHAGSHDEDGLHQGNFGGVVTHGELAHKVGYRPEQQQDSACRQQRRH